jgi:hypothetical protein
LEDSCVPEIGLIPQENLIGQAKVIFFSKTPGMAIDFGKLPLPFVCKDYLSLFVEN